MIANVSKNNTGKLLVAVLAMFMIVAGAAVVLGSEVNATGDSNAEDGVASIGDQYYSTLDLAIKDATSGTPESPAEIKLLKDTNLKNENGDYKLQNVIITADTEVTLTLNSAIWIEGTVGLENIKIAADGPTSMLFYTGYGGNITFSLTKVSFDESTTIGEEPLTIYTDKASTVDITDSDLTNTLLVYAGNDSAKPTTTITNSTNVDMNISSPDTVTIGTDIKIDGTSTIGDVRLAESVKLAVPEDVTFTAESIEQYDGTSNGSIVTDNPSNVVAKVEGVPITNTTGTNIVTEVEDGKTYENVCFHNVTVNPGVTISVKGSIEISGDFRLFGTINNADTTDVTINVPEGATFTAYSGASFGKNVYLDGAGKIDVSAAMEDFQVNQNVNGDYIYPQFQRVIITETLTIKSGNTMTVLGELVINEGVTLIVENGAFLQIGDEKITAVGVTVNGTIEIDVGVEDGDVGGTMNVVNAANVNVSGTIVSNGDLQISSNVTVKNGGSITIEDAPNSKITVTDGKNFVIDNGGSLTISGQMDIAAINNKGTITLDEAKIVGDSRSVINMAADGAIVDIISFSSNGEALYITDNGLNAGKDQDKKDVIIGTYEGTKVNGINISEMIEDMGIEGLTITESVTSKTVDKKVVYTNIMYISGTIDVCDNRDDTTQNVAKYPKIELNGQSGIVVATDASVVLGEKVTLQVNDGKLTVDGNIDAIDGKFTAKTANTGDVYVNGTVTVKTSDSNLDTIMNAFHYSNRGSTSADKYEVYTNLTNALANSKDIDYMGEVEILESVTIPAETTVKAANGAKLAIGSTDDRTVTVTVANGGTLRDAKGGITVYGSLVFENDAKDNRNNGTINCDVTIDESPKMTYTNVYTALNNAENGTVTIRQNATVFLDDDIEVKSGVTLVIPANTNLYMDNGVIMTVNGTVENSGNIASMIPNPDETAATTTAYVAGDGFKPLDKDEDRDPATIVVNGAFKSMTFTAYDDYYIPGAYYQIIDTEGAWYWITPVESAAAVAATAEDGISIYGEVTVGDVAFNGTEDVTVEVTIMNGAELNAGTITLSRAVIGFEENGTGAFTGTIGSAVGSVAFVNANGFSMADSVDTDDVETTSLVGTAKKAITDGADAAVTVATGNIIVDGLLNVNGVAFTIASGATVTVTGNNAELTTEGDEDNDKLSVDGTLVVTENGTVDVKILTVRGTLNVLPADRDNGVAAGKMEVETLYVGIALEKDTTNKFGDASAGVVSADVTSKPTQIIVSSESTITGKLIEGMNSTEFFVEDALWITVYYNGSQKIYDHYIPADLNECKFNGWNDANGKLIDDKTDGATIGAENYKQVYANIDYNVYKVVITLDNTVGSVAIDGQMLVYDTQLGGYVLPNNQLLTAGQHTVTYTLTANYEGTPTLSSSTVQVSGMTFTLSGDYEDVNASGDKTINYYLSLGGATLADTSIVIDGGSGDDGMSLTDILLIVLVVLILVMAIIVALRLMRS